MFKPTHTLLLITRQVLARVDVTAGKTPQVRKSWLRPRFDSESIATLVDATLRLGPRRAGRVWVLSSDFWTGVVSLPPDVSTLLAQKDLEQSVALEAESYSGISAFDSRLGLRPLENGAGGELRFWATQVAGIELSEMENTVRACGAAWGGAAHPAIVVPPQSGGDAAWQTVQAWGETTIASRGRGPMLSEIASVGGRIDAASTRSELARWQTADPETPTLWISDTTIASDLIAADDSLLRVDQLPDLTPWAVAWTRGVADASNAPPLIRAEKRPLSQERQIFLAASLGLLAIGVGFAHNQLANGHLDQVDASVKQLEDQKKQFDADKKALADLQKRNQTAEDEIAKIDARRAQWQNDLALAQRAVSQQRHRWVALIDALLEMTDNNSWVRSIDGKSKEAVIHGMAISDAAANRFASDLEAAAGGEGWSVQPARTTLADNSLTDFTIALEVVPPRPDDADPSGSDADPAGSKEAMLTGTAADDVQAKRFSRSPR